MPSLSHRSPVLVFVVVIFLSACTAMSPQVAVAPVQPQLVENSSPRIDSPMEPPLKPLSEAPVDAVADNLPKSDFYTVKPGDTLIRIGLDSGQSHKDIARWNGLSDPGKIVAGQVLRLIPLADGEVSPNVKSVIATVVPVSLANDDELTWTWPTHGPILSAFNQSKRKGLEIGGAAGDSVVAAADGKVVYAGAGLRSYGNVIILKHNSTYVTLYAHNQTLLVKEDESVKRGQRIAEVGSSESDRAKLHFEVRKLGNPVDPAQYLPSR